MRERLRTERGDRGEEGGTGRGADGRAPRDDSGGGGPEAGAATSGGLLFTLDDSGGLRPLRVRTGVTDGRLTQVRGPDLAEGIVVVIGIDRSGGSSGPTSPFAPNGGRGGRPPGPPGAF
jgi:hypothetical protein